MRAYGERHGDAWLEGDVVRWAWGERKPFVAMRRMLKRRARRVGRALAVALVALSTVGCDEARVSAYDGVVILAWRPEGAAHPDLREGVLVWRGGVVVCGVPCVAVVGEGP